MESACPPAARTCSAVPSALAALMSATTTHAPSRANSSAEAWPMPEPAPVTTATRPCSLLTSGFQGLQDLVRMAFDFDVGEDGLDRAGLVDDERGARNAHVFATHELLQLPDAVPVGHGMVGVGQEREGQMVFGLELLVGFDRVRAHAEDLGAVLVEQAAQVPERACLSSAAGGVVARVEVQDDGLLALEVSQTDVAVVRGREVEVR